MPKVIRPAEAGASKLGGIQPIAADQQFQTLKLPDLSGKAKGAQRLGAGITTGAEGFAIQMLADKRDDENISLLETQMQGDEELRRINEKYLSLNEGNAVGAGAKAKAEMDTFITGLGADPKDMTAAGKIARRRYTNSLRSSVSAIENHERAEKKKYISSMMKTAIATAQETGIDHYDDDEKLATQAGLIAQRSREVARLTMRGEAADILAEKLRSENISKMYAGAINRALAQGQEGRAEELLKTAQAGDLLDANNGDLATAIKAVNIGTDNKFAKTNATTIMADSIHGATLTSALAEGRRRAGKDADKEDALVTEITKRFGEIEAARKIDLRKKKIDAVGMALDGKFDQIPKENLAALGTMAKALEAMSNRKATNTPLTSDKKLHVRLNKITNLADLETELLKSSTMNKLSETDYRMFSNRLNANPSARTALQTRTQIVTSALKVANLNDNDVYEFNSKLDIALAQIEATNGGKKPTSTEIREQVDLLLIDGEYVSKKGYGAGPDIRAFALPKGEKFVRWAKVSDVPDEIMEKMKKAAQSYKVNMTEQQLLDRYNEQITRRIRKSLGHTP